MKITKQQLKQIIQEELLKEEYKPYRVRDLAHLAENNPEDYEVKISLVHDPGTSFEIHEVWTSDEDGMVNIALRRREATK